MTTPSDQPARDAIVERLDENMVVEAGAGTGKTRSLVERVVALITTGRASMGGIAAITFTEAAAAELRSRIGETLERVSADLSRQHAERERCERAVDDLDQASIQTLHSFAGSLLRERPLEAGLPPGFNVRDEIEAEVAFEKKWSEWLDATLDDPGAQETLRPALEEGMTLRHIREIAVRFHKNYDLLVDVTFDMPSEQATAGGREAELLPVLKLLRCFALDYADERKAAGEVEFRDLLVLARDLLRDSLSARDHFRGRYSHILIDEVQDTDPLQAELAMFLAEDVADGMDSTDRPLRWRDVRPAAGKLFIVGDAKQSIYRFRRADIRQVKLMQGLVGGSNALLTRNFRSLPAVINWVNHVFAQWMTESESQAEYSPLDAVSVHGEPPPVRYMGGAIGGNIGDVRRQEADAVARTIRTAVEEGWQVRSEDLGPETRPAKYQDVCVLMPSRLGLDALEFAFETAGIPYRLDSAGLIYESQEARDLLNCLGAIDDPTDQVSVVAALRSPALACSDADLLDFVESGGQFDYLADDDTPSGYATDALAILRDFHERRRWIVPCCAHRRIRAGAAAHGAGPRRPSVARAVDALPFLDRPRTRLRRVRRNVSSGIPRLDGPPKGGTGASARDGRPGVRRGRGESDDRPRGEGAGVPYLDIGRAQLRPDSPPRRRPVRSRMRKGGSESWVGGLVLSDTGLCEIGRTRQEARGRRGRSADVRCGDARPRSPHRQPVSELKR